MDPSGLAQLGVTATLIFAVAALVNPTVNQFKAALLLDSRSTLVLAYGLSFVLTIVLAFMNPLDWSTPLYVMAAKTLVGGWASAVYAGTMSNTQRATDDKIRAYNAQPPSFLPPED
jgi:hypothetical protein